MEWRHTWNRIQPKVEWNLDRLGMEYNPEWKEFIQTWNGIQPKVEWNADMEWNKTQSGMEWRQTWNGMQHSVEWNEDSTNESSNLIL